LCLTFKIFMREILSCTIKIKMPLVTFLIDIYVKNSNVGLEIYKTCCQLNDNDWQNSVAVTVRHEFFMFIFATLHWLVNSLSGSTIPQCNFLGHLSYKIGKSSTNVKTCVINPKATSTRFFKTHDLRRSVLLLMIDYAPSAIVSLERVLQGPDKIAVRSDWRINTD
jgi:hypothetical protein